MPEKSSPKLFISYSWSSPEHIEWVLNLATELVKAGVSVILDKWDLREGDSSVAFMEKMVSDPEIKKVAMIMDKKYKDKADGRDGGVGTETQIISQEVYEKQQQNKFVAIISCKDEEGNAFLPVYYKGRIYIDLSDDDNYIQNFEQLLRWIYDKPIHTRPALGKPPSFIDDSNNNETLSPTTAAYRRAHDALKNDKSYAESAVEDYFSEVIRSFEQFRVKEEEGVAIDDLIVKSINNFLHSRNEVIGIFLAIARYQPTDEMLSKIHYFFEQSIQYMDGLLSGKERAIKWGTDNFKFIVHELFLYAVASFIKYKRFVLASSLMSHLYYVEGRADGQKMNTFTTIRSYMDSLEHRNNRLECGRRSIRADLLKERCNGLPVDFRSLMQADFIALLRSDFDYERYPSWWPETLVYLTGDSFEIFLRSESTSYFEEIKQLLGVGDVSELNALIYKYDTGEYELPRVKTISLDLQRLLNIEKLCTRP